MTATQFMLGFAAVAGPWLVALMRRRTWDADVVTVVAAVFSLACFVAGQAADNALAWPLPGDFWLGLAATYGLNQAGYLVTKRVAPDKLEQVERM